MPSKNNRRRIEALKAKKGATQGKPNVKIVDDPTHRRYIDRASFSDGKKLYCCDVLTGKLTRADLKKTYYEDPSSKQVIARYYVMPTPTQFFLAADSLEDAKRLFEEHFVKMEEDLEYEDDSITTVDSPQEPLS